MTEYLYRFEGYVSRKIPMYINGRHCKADEGAGILLCKFPIVRKTKFGVWIFAGVGHGDKNGLTFVLLGCRKQYAYETVEDAMKSFKIRKNKQVGYLTSILSQARRTNNAIKKDKPPKWTEVEF